MGKDFNDFKKPHLYSNAATNALLSCENITSTIRQYHCLCCDFLTSMKMIGQNPSTQSSYPLKEFVARVKPQFWSSDQQDIVEFVGHVIR